MVIWYQVWFLNRSIWPIDKTLSGAITPDESESGNNGNYGYSTFSRTEVSLSVF